MKNILLSMKNILLGTLTMMAISPALIFASDVTVTEMQHTGMHHSGSMMGSGTMGSGMHMDMKGLHADIAKLSATQKIALTKIIREYLISQGITPTTSTTVDEVKAIRSDIKETRQKTQEELKEMRATQREAMKAKREALKASLKAKREQLKEVRTSDSN